MAVFNVPLPWSELAQRAWRDALEDDILGQAAQLAYYLFLALFPALLFMLALASFFPLAAATDDIVRQLAPLVSAQVLDLIQEQMLRLGDQNDGGLLTLGAAGALWSSSAARVSITSAMTRAYDITEARPWWKVRLISIALTIGVAVFVVLAWGLVLMGPVSARWLAEAGGGPVAEWTWRVLQWPLAFALVSIAIGLVYGFAPDAEQDWRWITPGAVVATALWLMASLAFRFYISNFTDYTASYGAVGGVIVLMLWFYVSSLAVMAGAELNAEIEHASPHGKAPGQKTPQGRRLLGARAARAHAATERPGTRPAVTPAVEDARSPRPSPFLGGIVVGTMVLARWWQHRRPSRPPHGPTD